MPSQSLRKWLTDQLTWCIVDLPTNGGGHIDTIKKNISILYRQFQVFLNHELEDSDITAIELMYLLDLYKQDGITQDELLKEYCIDKAAKTRVIQKMEKKGLVQREVADGDKRAKKVFLTEKANGYRELISNIQKKWLEAMWTSLDVTEDDMKIFVKVLAAVTERVQEINQAKEF